MVPDGLAYSTRTDILSVVKNWFKKKKFPYLVLLPIMEVKAQTPWVQEKRYDARRSLRCEYLIHKKYFDLLEGNVIVIAHRNFRMGVERNGNGTNH
jgi:hypothetical protein